MKQQAGFTLIELVVVILILSVLAATALPRFMNVTEDAHVAAVSGAGGGMGSAVVLAHAQWVANGHTGAEANLVGFGDGTVDTNASGWPVDTAGAATLTTTAHCMSVWNGIMQNPPVVDTAAAAGVDYVVTIAGNTCTFTYQGGGTMNIVYNSTTGNVATDAVF